ncbi:MAG: hypothetical protein COA96_04430 [SAR86 cluster bacterium]|uniref:TonB-dependent receptor n=1 Tax=SAR86 cluster bacterium TaxID=2030880 RepID=A0A2A5B691_9GAMM|nr:MAG: hypothetical protein COA96_04430 [SAR86 cluster bacterium]
MKNPLACLGLTIVGAVLVFTEAAVAQSVGATREAPQIEEIAVIGQFVPDEKRATAAVSNVIGQEQFTRSGDSNIAEGLKRVAGLSTVGGKYVYVRGLGERYSTTLLNGSLLPSPEPINRVVPLDLFPTAIMDSVLVQKTYSAQFPSEFGGGVLQLRTKKSTDELFWNLSSTISGTQNTSFRTGLTMPGGDSDWLGYDDGYRDIPTALKVATANGQELKRTSQFFGGSGYSGAQLQSIGRSLRNEYNVEKETLPADFNISSSFGNFHEIGRSGMRLSYLAALDYSNSWDTRQIERNSYKTSDAGLEIDDDLDYFGTEHSIDVSSIFTSSLDFNQNHNIRLTTVLLRKTDDIVSELVGDQAAEAEVKVNEIEWIERELFSNQLQGDHYFPDYNELVLNWRYSNVKAERDAPDTRKYRYDLFPDGYRFSTRADGNVRRFSVLDDTAENLGIDLTMTFYGPANSVITAHAGFERTEKRRDSEIRRYSYFDQGSIASNQELLLMSLEEILQADNIDPDGFELREFTRPTDSYNATNESDAYYIETEVNFDDRLRFSLGFRSEDFSQNVSTFDLFRDGVEVNAKQTSNDLLPAFNATFINQDHQFRIAYSETLSRPDFRELSPAAFTDPLTGREIVGNPDLKIASIKNYDFRWEWYFGFNDYMSFGLFYKEFNKPIESIVQPGADKRLSFVNANSGENMGAEFELTKSLEFLGGIWEDVYIQGNVTHIDSTVEIAEVDRGVLTNTSRALQGQSDWLFNAQIGYEPFSGKTATLLYHYSGERISQVGTSGAPDLIEQPFGELNVVYIQEISDNWKLTLKAKNLFDEASEVTQGGLITTSFNRGRELSLKIDYRF